MNGYERSMFNLGIKFSELLILRRQRCKLAGELGVDAMTSRPVSAESVCTVVTYPHSGSLAL